MVENSVHEAHMREAIALALTADPAQAHPNPRVGAVVVENGDIVARGAFERDGEAHAERKALTSLGRDPQPGATLYVTLEPCSTHGRTGACTDAIIASGIKNVVIGALDPTPSHCGNALAVLIKAGINVVSDVLKSDCEEINPDYKGRISGCERGATQLR